MNQTEATARGHRTLPHTADLMIEAWAPTREGCLEETVPALVDTFLRHSPAAATMTLPVDLQPAADDELLRLLLEDVIYAAEVLGAVPVSASLAARPDGGLHGIFTAVPVTAVSVVGAVPKAVTRHGLQVVREPGRWVARAVIDV